MRNEGVTFSMAVIMMNVPIHPAILAETCHRFPIPIIAEVGSEVTNDLIWASYIGFMLAPVIIGKLNPNDIYGNLIVGRVIVLHNNG